MIHNTHIDEMKSISRAQLLDVSPWYCLSLHGSASGAGIMNLLNLQVSTDRQFDWSPVPFRPIKLSVSA